MYGKLAISEGFKRHHVKITETTKTFFSLLLKLEIAGFSSKRNNVKTVKVSNVKDIDKYNEAVAVT